MKVAQWGSYHGLLHGFMGRRGGQSSGRYAGLNASYHVGDDAKTVSQNVCNIKQAVGIHEGRIVTMRQVHGDHIIEVNDKTRKEAGAADGMVSAEQGVNIGVLTADCVPLLLIAPRQKIVAAVHAGWRGTLAGIAAKMVNLFKEKYGVSAKQVEAALGPSIGACCYEVKEDVTTPLIAQWDDLASASLQARAGKSYLDLRKFNQGILERTGVPVNQIYHVGPCTSCFPEDFYSYRRERNETGRQISFIGWAV